MKATIGFPWEVGSHNSTKELDCKLPCGSGVCVRFERQHFDRGPGWFVLHTGCYVFGPASDAQEAIDYAEKLVIDTVAKYVAELGKMAQEARDFLRLAKGEGTL